MIQQFYFWLYTVKQGFCFFVFETVIHDPLVDCEINLKVITNIFNK